MYATTTNDLILYLSLVLLLLPLLLVPLLTSSAARNGRVGGRSSLIPKSYPLIGMEIARYKNRKRRMEWTTEYLRSTPSLTLPIHRHFPIPLIIDTANPANIEHILKTNFSNYEKGPRYRDIFHDFLGHGIFNADGDNWKHQRRVASNEFSTKSLRKFIETVVDTELLNRLDPILASAAESGSILDLQDLLKRFAFDNICQIAFGHDPAYLSPDLPQAEFAKAFERSTFLTSERYFSILPIWKIKKLFNIGSEKDLRNGIAHIRGLASKIIQQKKAELESKPSSTATSSSHDLLSRFLNSGLLDENFVIDIVISFILAGRDTTSAALTWFFWLISKHPKVESEILQEISQKCELNSFNEVREMTYTHAALCESMRLYPPVPADAKQALDDDVLPDGTVVKKGNIIAYIPYAMGRMERLWGADWEEFKPERWLEKDEATEKKKLVSVDHYKYPVFHAGPRICLGKDMAFLQMKRVVAAVLLKYKVAPVLEGFEPEFEAHLTAKMKGGFSVRVEKRQSTSRPVRTS